MPDVKITAPFMFQNKWFFEGDRVSGDTAEAAIAAGAADKPKKAPKRKASKAAPENKGE